MRRMCYFFCCTVILALIVPVANVKADERVILQKEFSAWREQLKKQRKDILRKHNCNELTFDNIMPAPDEPELWPLWRDWLSQWRKDQRKALNYDDKYYSVKDFAWIPSSLVSTKFMSWDMLFINPETGKYTVDKFLEYGQKEYGGFDNIILWQAYPRIGFDERNQFDFYRDLPGGSEGLRGVTKACHEKGVGVFIAYNPWDTGTRREGTSDEAPEIEKSDDDYYNLSDGSADRRTKRGFQQSCFETGNS